MSEKGIKGTSLTTAAICVHVPIYCPEALMMLIIIRIRADTHGDDEWEQQQRQLKSGIKNSGGGKGLGPTFSECGDEEGGLSNSAWSQFDGRATTTLGNGDDDAHNDNINNNNNAGEHKLQVPTTQGTINVFILM